MRQIYVQHYFKITSQIECNEPLTRYSSGDAINRRVPSGHWKPAAFTAAKLNHIARIALRA